MAGQCKIMIFKMFLRRLADRFQIILINLLSVLMLEAINIFHYEQFWRLQGAREVSHRCGGALTLIIILLLGGLIGYEMVQLTQLTTITASTQSQINFTSPLTALSTYQNDTKVEPFMAAMVIINPLGIAYSYKEYNISAYYSIQTYNKSARSYIYNYSKITMEECTPQHFSKMPDAYNKFQTWGMSNWLCLPLNSVYEIGGNVLQYVKYIRVDVKCLDSDPTCIQTKGPLFPNLLTLNTFVNPNSNQEPLIAYLQRRQAALTQGFSSRNYIYLNRNILSTDSSLTPFEYYDYKSCFQEGSYTNSNSFSSAAPSATYFIILSGKTVTSNRSYLKILTSLSFIGGLVAPLLTLVSLISMITKFGAFLYQLKFAKQFFKTNASMQTNYFGFLQQAAYSFLSKCFRRPEWELPKKRDQYIKRANRLLDVVYLQRRVALLEKATSILFQKHQLTGLYLLRTTSKEEADNNYFSHQLRKNFLLYFKQHPSGSSKERQPDRKKPIDINLNPNQRQEPKIGRNREKQSYFAEKNKLISNQPKNATKHVYKKALPKQQQNQPNEKIGSACAIKRIELGEPQAEDYRDEFDSQFGQQVYLERQFVHQILSQLRQLSSQARDRYGDWRSKRIYCQLDKKIKERQYGEIILSQAQAEL